MHNSVLPTLILACVCLWATGTMRKLEKRLDLFMHMRPLVTERSLEALCKLTNVAGCSLRRRASHWHNPCTDPPRYPRTRAWWEIKCDALILPRAPWHLRFKS